MAKQVTILTLSETAALVTYKEAGETFEKRNPNLERQRLDQVARGTSEVMPLEPFHSSVSIFAKKETRLPRDIIMAQERHTVAWLTTINRNWIEDGNVSTMSL